MTSRPDRPIQITLTVKDSQPEFLLGLEAWIRLGLLSDTEVKQICQSYLTCPLPVAIAQPRPTRPEPAQPVIEPSSPRERRADLPVPSSVVRPVPRPPSKATQLIQSLMAEISVVWLLFLGVFMVVVSSGVLAASQWRNFPPVGQYGILLAYTIAFWFASIWTGQQQNLQITSRMLKIATLLIIPVNFWMIDAFHLWRSLPQGLIAAIAAVVLTFLFTTLLKIGTSRFEAVRLMMINGIGLSWLHLGWDWAPVPLVATYIGTIGTAALVFYQTNSSRHQRGQASEDAPTSGRPRTELSLGSVAITFALLLLVGRALLTAEVTIQQLGLAIGICGWLLAWLSIQTPARRFWEQSGALLMILGWAASLTVEVPWQALTISGLGLWLLGDRLRRLWLKLDLTLLFLVGLQAGVLLWQIVRATFSTLVTTLYGTILPITGEVFMPWASIGVVFLSYVGLTLWGANQLKRLNHPDLADHAEELALLLGVGLAMLSAPNPTMRVLNLGLSTVILAVVVRHREPANAGLIYLTHITGLAAIAAGVDRVFPALSATSWAGITLSITVAEWIGCATSPYRLWRRSAWHLGLVLATLSYVFLAVVAADQAGRAILIGLVVPTALCWLGTRPSFWARSLAISLSTLILLALQYWALLPQPIGAARLISLGVATGLMVINTQQRPNLVMAVPTVGFGLALFWTSLWELGGHSLSPALIIQLLAGTIAGLWLLRAGMFRYRPRLAIYARAMDGWAFTLGLVTLLLLTLHSFLVVQGGLFSPSMAVVRALVILGAAIVFRSWQRPTGWTVYGFGWTLEIITVEVLAFTDATFTYLAIANIGLGLVSQLVGDWWNRRSETPFPASWHVLPLLYGAIAVLSRWETFETWTGWTTLGVSFILLGIGRRDRTLKPLVYLGLIGISASAYEILLYQLFQTVPLAAGDQVLALAVVGTGILYGYRMLSPWLTPLLGLDELDIQQFAHLYWALSSGCLMMAIALSVQSTITLGLGSGIFLASYAIAQGRNNSEGETASHPAQADQAPFWIFAGVAEGTAIALYLLNQWLPDHVFEVLAPWAGAIAAIVALLFYASPWETWGWPLRPWRQVAIALPLVVIWNTSAIVSNVSLLGVAALYLFYARYSRTLRLTYLSVLLVDWVLLRVLAAQGWQTPLWMSVIVGGSLLYVAQMDPALREDSARSPRHLLRCFATGLICITALYQAEGDFQLGFLTAAIGIAFVLAGLLLRVRAFLYLGTLTFIVQVLLQFWLFVNDHSLVLWAVGIVLGLILIWVAGTFEARRSQVLALVDYWTAELERWE